MNRQQILLALALHEAGVPLEVDKFDKRLVIQKSVYLLQESGVYIGYRYRWYLFGPYSSDLANDAFLLAGDEDGVSEEVRRWELDPESCKTIKRLRKLFTMQSLTDRAKRLELLASVLFLIRTGQADPTDTKTVSKILKINNKPFGAKEVVSALAELRKYGFAL